MPDETTTPTPDPQPWADVKHDDRLLCTSCLVCAKPFTDEDAVVRGIHKGSLYVALHDTCNTGEDTLTPKGYAPPSAEQIRKSKAARERLRTEFGVDIGATWCPTCVLPTKESRPAHDADPKSVTCDHCQTTWDLTPLPAPTPPPPPTELDEAQQCKSPSMAATHAQHALRTFLQAGKADDLTTAVVYLSRCCQLLAFGQRSLQVEIAELDHRSPDLDTEDEPTAPPPPGVEPPTRTPIPTAAKVAVAAQAAAKLQPTRA